MAFWPLSAGLKTLQQTSPEGIAQMMMMMMIGIKTGVFLTSLIPSLGRWLNCLRMYRSVEQPDLSIPPLIHFTCHLGSQGKGVN